MTDQAKAGKPIVLTIAGFDPSGGAGTIADIRTIESMECRAVAAITSLTFQNAEKFFGASYQTAESVRAQIESISGEQKIAAVKIGMLPTADIAREVARLILELNLPRPVIDPVMNSTTGGKLMSDDAINLLTTELMPLARVVTPNIPEAEKLTSMKIEDEGGMGRAAAKIRELGARAVLIKGGHLDRAGAGRTAKGSSSAPELLDVLDDDGRITFFRSERIGEVELRGSGCILSSGIAAGLAKGMTLEDSMCAAKRFVTNAFQALL